MADEHVAYERRHVYGSDLKEWAKSIAPSERPAFLFDEVERDIHPGITQETYQALKAAHDAKEQNLIRASGRIRKVEDERGRLENECCALRGMVDGRGDKLRPRRRSTSI
ncbi:hypothetical protein K788_0002237 [Paraburkholderia caribensis MBA4]|uniref:Uncharacterized protein n=1 Tax=Paraburkholderia caribensis MBA4 TaxID=1323664 RepID=A0A0P0R8Y3_9BURK|nr:hypothetical protein [Paraburkholderia caribensis]ALL64723.1 hypothetical protein K788_0002237 [Paraburkholderia caribensis MBA4]